MKKQFSKFLNYQISRFFSAKCDWYAGEGYGSGAFYIGKQKGRECVAACMKLGKTDEKINGARVFKNGNAGCWCERGDRFFL